jgi:hypothetical protein
MHKRGKAIDRLSKRHMWRLYLAETLQKLPRNATKIA